MVQDLYCVEVSVLKGRGVEERAGGLGGGDNKESPPVGHEEIGDALAIKLRRRKRGNRTRQFRKEIVAGLAAGIEEQSERRPTVLE